MGNFLLSLITDAAEERAKKRALEKKRTTIRELIYTEENYLSNVLENLVNFKTTLSATLDETRSKTLFANVEDLVALTRSVLAELKSAVENAELVNIGLSFVNHKYDLTTYAIYCTKLPKSKILYDSIMAGDNVELMNEIVKVEQSANVESARLHPSTYKPYTLKALLQEPAIRCYRYADILKGIGKYCDDKSSAEYESLFLAAEIMTDISQLCNICLRDRENLDVIAVIEANLVNIKLGDTNALTQYGRLRRYGKLTLEYPQDGDRYERICFVFDKIMLVTRKVFNQYYFERALVLDKYNLGTAANIEPALKSKKSIISSALQEMLNKYKTMFYLDAVGPNVAPYSVKFYCADERRKAEWISALSSAKKNTQPAGYRNGHHKFYMHTFTRAEDCDYCGRLMKGLFWQGYICAVTHKVAHRQCIPGLSNGQTSNIIKVEFSRSCEDTILRELVVPTILDKSLLTGYSAKLTRSDKLKKTALFEKVRKRDDNRGAQLPQERRPTEKSVNTTNHTAITDEDTALDYTYAEGIKLDDTTKDSALQPECAVTTKNAPPVIQTGGDQQPNAANEFKSPPSKSSKLILNPIENGGQKVTTKSQNLKKYTYGSENKKMDKAGRKENVKQGGTQGHEPNQHLQIV